MKRLLIAVAVIMLISSNAHAQEQERTALAKQLAEVLGFESMIAGLKDQAQRSSEAQLSQVMSQFKKSFPELPPQFMKELEDAGAVFVRKASDSWDPAEAARIYTTALADTLPEKQLRASIEHYRTPEGQLQLKAIYQASAQMNAYVLSRIDRAAQEGMQEFIASLKQIAEKAQRDHEAARKDQRQGGGRRK